MRAADFLNEIERLSKSGFEGGKDYLDSYGKEKVVRKLPGGSGLLYSITNDRGDFTIKIWDPKDKGEYPEVPMRTERPPFYTRSEWARRIEYIKRRNAEEKEKYEQSPGKLIGQLTVMDASYYFPLKGAMQVGTITVDEDYRGVGIAKALYGIVLTILKRPLLAGSSQTPGGRRNWMSLSQIPGVEMKGYFKIDDSDIKTLDPKNFDHWDATSRISSHNKAAEKRIDIIMSQLGGQYIGQNKSRHHYFAFDVKPDTTKQELKAYVDTNLSKVYSSGYYSGGGLYATWTGQQ